MNIPFINIVEAQRPDIVDEILPEVKQKNQIGYLNCTVVNKGSESVVSTDLHNDHIFTMLNTCLIERH